MKKLLLILICLFVSFKVKSEEIVLICDVVESNYYPKYERVSYKKKFYLFKKKKFINTSEFHVTTKKEKKLIKKGFKESRDQYKTVIVKKDKLFFQEKSIEIDRHTLEVKYGYLKKKGKYIEKEFYGYHSHIKIKGKGKCQILESKI